MLGTIVVCPPPELPCPSWPGQARGVFLALGVGCQAEGRSSSRLSLTPYLLLEQVDQFECVYLDPSKLGKNRCHMQARVKRCLTLRVFFVLVIEAHSITRNNIQLVLRVTTYPGEIERYAIRGERRAVLAVLRQGDLGRFVKGMSISG